VRAWKTASVLKRSLSRPSRGLYAVSNKSISKAHRDSVGTRQVKLTVKPVSEDIELLKRGLGHTEGVIDDLLIVNEHCYSSSPS